MPYPPLSPSAVAEIVRRYQRGESTPRIARALHLANSTVVRALDTAGVPRRGRSEAASIRWQRQPEPTCRACGIILAKAGCGNRDGVCDECWGTVAGFAAKWGVSVEEALGRWVRESAEAGATELEEATEAELGEWCGNIKRRVA